MSDSYQAIYNAVRSRISNGDIGQAVSDAAFRQFDISHITPLAQQAISILEYEHSRPSVLFKPRVFKDGNAWCALYGENLVEGVSGFGDTPEAACHEFDREWRGIATPIDKEKVIAAVDDLVDGLRP